MGLMDFVRSELIDIVEWIDNSQDSLLHRFERHDNEIKNGAKLVVRPGQVAVFVNEGVLADVFQSGTFTLETKNLPVLSTLKGWKYGFDSPFKAEVYFVSTKLFTGRKWGTRNPVMLRDPEFGPLRIRAFGNFAFRISDPAAFVREISGTNGHFRIDGMEEQLRDQIVSGFSDSLAESKVPVLDLAARYDEISELVRQKLSSVFSAWGVGIEGFVVENISLPEDVEKAIDQRTRMGVLGNLQAYTQLQVADSISTAAANPGMAGAAMGMGAGFAMGGQMAQQMGQAAMPASYAPPPPLPGGPSFHVALGGQQAGPFGVPQIQGLVAQGQLTPQTLVWATGMAQWTQASQVPALAGLFTAPPPLPGAVPPPLPGTPS
ncbi:MAG: SPFH domain-containing protein [Fibrobacteria bacterium]|nr:SPFH domain-containing protein [Fibrobacteria bacterium]